MSFVQNNLSIGEIEDHPVSSGKRGLADSSRQTLEGEIRRFGGEWYQSHLTSSSSLPQESYLTLSGWGWRKEEVINTLSIFRDSEKVLLVASFFLFRRYFYFSKATEGQGRPPRKASGDGAGWALGCGGVEAVVTFSCWALLRCLTSWQRARAEAPQQQR